MVNTCTSDYMSRRERFFCVEQPFAFSYYYAVRKCWLHRKISLHTHRTPSKPYSWSSCIKEDVNVRVFIQYGFSLKDSHTEKTGSKWMGPAPMRWSEPTRAVSVLTGGCECPDLVNVFQLWLRPVLCAWMRVYIKHRSRVVALFVFS